MKINAVICNKCGDTVFSRTKRDMRYCSCGAIAVDGGFSYIKTSGNAENITHTIIDVETDKEILYNDWNKAIDKLGLIKAKSSKKEI